MTRLLAVCFPLCAITFIGCSSGGSGGGSTAPPQPIGVSVSPNAATIDATNPINITAAVANNPNNDGVSWTVSGNNTQGTLSTPPKPPSPTPRPRLSTVFSPFTSPQPPSPTPPRAPSLPSRSPPRSPPAATSTPPSALPSPYNSKAAAASRPTTTSLSPAVCSLPVSPSAPAACSPASTARHPPARVSANTSPTFSSLTPEHPHRLPARPVSSSCRSCARLSSQPHLQLHGPATGSLDTVTPARAALDNPITVGYSFDTAAPSAGTFNLSGSLTTGVSSCALLSSTEFVCIPQTDATPYIFIGRQ